MMLKNVFQRKPKLLAIIVVIIAEAALYFDYYFLKFIRFIQKMTLPNAENQRMVAKKFNKN